MGCSVSLDVAEAETTAAKNTMTLGQEETKRRKSWAGCPLAKWNPITPWLQINIWLFGKRGDVTMSWRKLCDLPQHLSGRELYGLGVIWCEPETRRTPLVTAKVKRSPSNNCRLKYEIFLPEAENIVGRAINSAGSRADEAVNIQKLADDDYANEVNNWKPALERDKSSSFIGFVKSDVSENLARISNSSWRIDNGGSLFHLKHDVNGISGRMDCPFKHLPSSPSEERNPRSVLACVHERGPA